MGAGTLGSYPKIELILLLLSTGVVFWAAHVHSRLFGVWLVHEPVGWAQVRRVGASEWPIVQAAVPPCVAVAVSPLLGLGLDGTEWLALAVAVAGQVGWASAAAVRSGAPRGLVVVSGAVNLLLGLVLVVLKASLQH
nr:hypothetical protein [Streptomyces sp. GC420]